MTRYQGSTVPLLTPPLLAILRAYQSAGGRATWLLEIDLATDPGHGRSRHPDGAVIVAGYVHPPASADHGALAGEVGRGHPPGGKQPLRQGRVETAGDRILDRATIDLEKRAHLESHRRSWRVRPGDSQIEIDRSWAQCQHRVSTGQEHRDPARTVVGPLCVDDLGSTDPKLTGNPVDDRLAHRAGSQQRRRGEAPPGPGSP